jgi:hypothetical protein
MQESRLDDILWAATFCGNLILLFVLWKRGRARSFPAFTALVAAYIARTVILVLVNRHLPHAYRLTFWWMSVVDEALQLLVVYEIALQVFRPTGVWAQDVWKTFLGLAGIAIILAAGLTWLDTPATTDHVQAYFFRANFFSAMLMSELFVAMVALSATSGLPWKTHVARIAQGFGIYSILSVGIDILTSVLGIRHATTVFIATSHLRIVTYLGCETYWIVMLWQEAPAPRELPERMRMQIYVLQRQVEHDLERIRNWGRRP